MFALLMPIGLLGPGWLLGRALRCASGITGAFLASSVILLNLVLIFDWLGLTIDRRSLAFGLAVICGVLALVARHRQHVPLATSAVNIPREKSNPGLFLPAALGFAAITLKALLDPLSGLDTRFRWDFLARQILSEGNLNFYPAVSAVDFTKYSWCDGIAPLVSSLYLWAYISLGEVSRLATSPIVILQAGLLFYCVYHIAAGLGGGTLGRLAISILATSATLLHAVAMGQETGMTALSLAAMLMFIQRHGGSGAPAFLIWAGIAAGTGGLAREYGLILPLLGVVTLIWNQVSFRKCLTFVISACLVAAPWYLRNWIRTGNPLYSHSLGGVFPSNVLHTEYLDIVADYFSPWGNLVALRTLGILLLILAGLPLLLGLLSGLVQGRKSGSYALAIYCFIGLWAWSISQTSGGYPYSFRVLAPALAIASITSALLLKSWLGCYPRWLGAVLTILAFDAAVRSLYLPNAPGVVWWRDGLFEWRRFPAVIDEWDRQPAWQAVTDAAGARSILTTDSFAFSLLIHNGGHPVAMYSPAVRHLFSQESDFKAGVERLRRDGFRYIIMRWQDLVIDTQLSHYPFFRELKAIPATHPLNIGPL